MRLDKLLKEAAGMSRSEAKRAIKLGRARINGIICTQSDIKLDPYMDEAALDGVILSYEKYIYLMMNKPAGIISAARDSRERCALELVPEKYRRDGLFIAGRLDKDTEGLLLITDDGGLAHDILSPAKHVPKTYFVKVSGRLTNEDEAALRQGIEISGGEKCLPAELSVIKTGEISEAELTIFEGKFHQVKRMFEALGKTVVYLKRIKMGGLELFPSLPSGGVIKLGPKDIFKLCGGKRQ